MKIEMLQLVIKTATLSVLIIGYSCVDLMAQTFEEDELNDNTSVPAKVYVIDGESYTYSEDLLDIELQLIGSWKSKSGELNEIQFTDPETVILTLSGSQYKGSWTYTDAELNIFVAGNGTKLPATISGKIESSEKMNTVILEGYGSFLKSGAK